MIALFIDSPGSADHLAPVLAGLADYGLGEQTRCFLVGDAPRADDAILSYLTRHKGINCTNTDDAPAELNNLRPGVIAMDMSCGLKPATKGIVDAANRLGIPVAGLPLSCNIDSDAWTPTSYPKLDSVERFDVVCVHRQAWKKRLVASGIRKERIHVLGSPRFCRQWLPALNAAYGQTPWPGTNDGHPRALVLLTFHPDTSVQMLFGAPVDVAQRNIRERELARALAQADDLDIVVKPHPKYVDAVPDEVRSTCTVAGADIPTPGLCRKADVVLGINTSALLDAFNLGLPVVYPKRMYELHMAFEDFGCCIPAQSPRESVAAMREAARTGAPYSPSSVERFLTHTTRAGDADRDVPAAYAQFLFQAAQKDGKQGTARSDKQSG